MRVRSVLQSPIWTLDRLEQQIQLVYTGLLSRGADRPGLAYWPDDFANRLHY